MRRANLIEPTKMILEGVPDPVPGPGEVRLKIETCGVCGSDIHAWHGKHYFIKCPIAPGHEFAGTIDMLGKGVTGWEIGQPVTAEPNIVCGECENCRSGKYNICDKLQVLGCTTDGAFAEYLIVPAPKIVPLDPHMTFEQGSLVEPLAVAVHALRLVAITPDMRLLILGAGTIGLMHLMVARGLGVKEITVTDCIPSKLDLARKLGAKYTVDIDQTKLAEFCRATYGAEMAFDLAVECVGTDSTIRDAIFALKKGSSMVVVGVFPKEIPVNLAIVQDHELKLVGSLMYRMDDFLEARNLIAAGRIPTDQLITSRYPLEQIDLAMKAIDEHPEENIKTMIHIRPQGNTGKI